MDELVRAAKTEEQRLIAKLQQVPAYQRLVAVQKLLELYTRQISMSGQLRPPQAVLRIAITDVATDRPDGTGQRAGRPGSLASRVANAAVQYLSSKGQRAQSTEILEAIQHQGIVIPGDNPVSGLASVLSHNPLFDNKRGAGNGYGLVIWNGEGDQKPGSEAIATSSQVSHNEIPSDDRESAGNSDSVGLVIHE